jgi:hypothetical protein
LQVGFKRIDLVAQHKRTEIIQDSPGTPQTGLPKSPSVAW